MESFVPEFTIDELASIVSRAIQLPASGFVVQEFSVDESTANGFIGGYYVLRVNVDCTSLKPIVESRKLSFLVNVSSVDNLEVFRKEMTLFREVFPRIWKVLGRKAFTPEIFLMRNQELLVMEDLKVRGYYQVKGNDGLLDGFQLRKAMDALAQLHAGTILVEDSEGKSLKEMYPGILDFNALLGDGDSNRSKNVDHIIGLWSEIVRRTEKNPKRLKIILNGLPKVIHRLCDFVQSSSQFRNVLCHGDLRSSNLLFKSLAGIAEDCVLVNYRMAIYAPPAYDLNLLISLSTSRNFRRQHFEDLVGQYFSTLRKLLDPHGITFSKESFMESCNYYRLAGLIHSCLIGPEALLPQRFRHEVRSRSDANGDFMSKTKAFICLKAFLTDVPYRTRLLDMIDELIDTEILNQ